MSSTNIEIVFKEMQEEYLGEVLGIYSYYVTNTDVSFHTRIPTPEKMRQMVFFEDSRYKTFVILAEQQICGYVIITRYKEREAYDITAEISIYLQPEAVRQGIGSLAVNFIEDYARRQGFHVLLAVISGLNEASIKLVAQNGYTKCAHYKEVGRKFGQFLDIVVYQKIIS
ncbi:MAG: N-acetyltransferase family protein [Syntrophomonadaceae bacterium]|nr:N-acetyltransferase family protein [Syntrophomonadaceae bacterium]